MSQRNYVLLPLKKVQKTACLYPKEDFYVCSLKVLCFAIGNSCTDLKVKKRKRSQVFVTIDLIVFTTFHHIKL